MTATATFRGLRRIFSLRRYLPRSLLGRSLLILVSPLILLQLFSAYVFFERHWDTVAIRLSRALAGDVTATLALIRENPAPEGRAAAIDFARVHFHLETRFLDGSILQATTPPDRGDRLTRVLHQALTESVRRPLWIDSGFDERYVLIRIQLTDGVLEVEAPRKRLFTSTTYLFIALMVGISLILFAVAMLFMNNQVRPIRRLAAAADALGKGRDVPSFQPRGAIEVRQAAEAFNNMRDRLQRQMSQRTEMLAGVSHDLRTPLTRMKLQLAMLGDGNEIHDLEQDVEEMQRMVDGYLAFARGEGSEALAMADLGRIAEDVVAAARRAGARIDFRTEGALSLPLRSQALQRCLTNLIANATRHGHHVVVRLARLKTSIMITIDDDGPGIPEEERENVFRPFNRLETSRNLETGGVGLGLTIARDVVQSHGGRITLLDSPLGGLRVSISLPV